MAGSKGGPMPKGPQTVEPGTCEACGCKLSRYRSARESECWACQAAGRLVDTLLYRVSYELRGNWKA